MLRGPLSKKLRFILFEDKSGPQYFEVPRSVIRPWALLSPTLMISGWIGLLFVALYFKEIRLAVKTQEPKIFAQLRSDLKAARIQIEGLDKKNSSLKQKISAKVTLPLDGLDLFASTRGQQDLTAEKRLLIEDIITSVNGNDRGLSFNLVNNTPNNEKVGGYLFVVSYSQKGIQVYPEEALADPTKQLLYLKGESFATSRFRPFNIRVSKNTSTEKVAFKVLVFSRSGDLILNHMISP